MEIRESQQWKESYKHRCVTPELYPRSLPRQWYDLDGPEQVAFPMKYAETLTPFQKLLLLRCFRVDRVYRAVTDYITVAMTEK